MDVRNNLLALNALLTPDAQRLRNDGVVDPLRQKPNEKLERANRQDLISLSDEGQRSDNQRNTNFRSGSRLLSEEIGEIENGTRRTQQFATENGRSFSRIEDIVTTGDQTRRTVTQQNESGSVTRLEDIYDRQSDGSFRLTQRFVDETGETQTNIQFDVIPDNRDIILGQVSNTLSTSQTPSLNPARGQQIDLRA